MSSAIDAARAAMRNPMRMARSLSTRANWNRWTGLEPEGFRELYAERLRPIEGWRYRQDLALLYGLARDLPGDGVTLEIGSFKGLATTALALGCRDGGRAPVHTVDPHTGDRQHLEALGVDELSSLEAFGSNIAAAGVADLVTAHVMTSDELSQRWDGSLIRLLFVDGWHSYEAVRSDLRNWLPRLEPGGVCVIDDYRNYDEVARAVDDTTELPSQRTRAGRMMMAHRDRLPDSAQRMLRVPWG